MTSAVDSLLNTVCAAAGVPPLALVMSYPTIIHVLYAVVWVRPSLFFPRSKPMDRVWHFRNAAYSKQVWFYSLLPWYLGTLDPARLVDAYIWRIPAQILAQPPLVLVLGATMLAGGVFLEIASFNAIGEAAILYGCKFGVDIEWVDNKFPYTWTAHPQHIGVFLVYSSLLMFGANLPGGTLGWGMADVVAWWFVLYGAQTLVEGNLAQDEHQALKAKAKQT